MSIVRHFAPVLSGLLWTAASAAAVGALQAPGAPEAQGPDALYPNAQPVRSCESLAGFSLEHTTVEDAVVDGSVCRVSAVSTHPPEGDVVRIWVAIPMTGWNGRFLGTGGGGFSGGSERGVSQPAAQGFAAGATDTGHSGASGSFALDEAGRTDWQSIRDNAHLGIHEMTVAGKAFTERLYGRPPGYSYFSGCSTGGRQALMEAQRYPQDYNGIVAGAPAINWPKLHVQQLWGPMLMHLEDNPVAPCKLAAATAAAVDACDMMDGVRDGLLGDPMRCTYDPESLVGTSSGDCGTFTEADASIIRRIWEGPRREDGSFMWYGASRGANLAALSGSSGTPLRPQAMGITLDWWRYFLSQDPEFDWTTVTRQGYERFWERSVEQFGEVIGTDNPNLRPFRDRGGKAILWHGWSDQLITASGTVDYYDRVVEELGSRDAAESFIRLFLAPGVGHCGGGGPTPTAPLDALMAWVEEGRAPEMLLASQDGSRGGTSRTRPLCVYPLVARYTGSGSTDEASSFVCSPDF